MQPGTSFAITSKCNDVDGAWAFIRTFLMDDWQYEHDKEIAWTHINYCGSCGGNWRARVEQMTALDL